MPVSVPPPPEKGDMLDPPCEHGDVITFLAKRRSVLARMMQEPGPDSEELKALLRLAVRVPDHGRLEPWRFLVIKDTARAQLGDILAQAWQKHDSHAAPDRLDQERQRFLRAPVCVTVISRVLENHKIPEWEQILSAGAACQNLLTAATAMGFAAQWLTEWYAYDRMVKEALGLKSGERIAGFIYLGSTEAGPRERARPRLEDLFETWQA